jgi:hypothetical protein
MRTHQNLRGMVLKMKIQKIFLIIAALTASPIFAATNLHFYNHSNHRKATSIWVGTVSNLCHDISEDIHGNEWSGSTNCFLTGDIQLIIDGIRRYFDIKYTTKDVTIELIDDIDKSSDDYVRFSWKDGERSFRLDGSDRYYFRQGLHHR